MEGHFIKAERERLEAENKRLREALDALTERAERAEMERDDLARKNNYYMSAVKVSEDYRALASLLGGFDEKPYGPDNIRAYIERLQEALRHQQERMAALEVLEQVVRATLAKSVVSDATYGEMSISETLATLDALYAQRREDMDLMDETLQAGKMRFAAIRKLKQERDEALALADVMGRTLETFPFYVYQDARNMGADREAAWTDFISVAHEYIKQALSTPAPEALRQQQERTAALEKVAIAAKRTIYDFNAAGYVDFDLLMGSLMTLDAVKGV